MIITTVVTAPVWIVTENDVCQPEESTLSKGEALLRTILSISKSVSTKPVRLSLRKTTRETEIVISEIVSSVTHEVASGLSDGQVMKFGDFTPTVDNRDEVRRELP